MYLRFMSYNVRLFIGLVLFVLASCTGSDQHAVIGNADTATQAPAEATPKPHSRNKLTDTMLAQLIDHYKAHYGEGSIRMTVAPSDTIVEVSFSDTSGDPDEFTGTLFTAYIPLVSHINPILAGDLDGAVGEDLLVTVHTEGGGGGGNMWWDEHFLFHAQAGAAYTIADVKADPELMDGSGHFFPRQVSGDAITGIANDYTDEDLRCCPSLYYRVTVKYINGKLTTTQKTPISRPAEFR